MRPITLTYTLRDGTRGRMACLMACTADAVTWAIEHFGLRLRTCAARAA